MIFALLFVCAFFISKPLKATKITIKRVRTIDDPSPDVFGRTCLHWFAILGYENQRKLDLSALDDARAEIAKNFIMKYGRATITKIDMFGKSPLDYSDTNQEKLPKVFAVMSAAKNK